MTAATVTASALPVAVPGLDYTSVAPTVLTFGPGEILKTFSVPILTANALSRSGNRLVGLELSSPAGAVLGAAGTATLTILDFRPDLVVTTVSTPAGTLSGKLVSAPTTVRNFGLVPRRHSGSVSSSPRTIPCRAPARCSPSATSRAWRRAPA